MPQHGWSKWRFGKCQEKVFSKHGDDTHRYIVSIILITKWIRVSIKWAIMKQAPKRLPIVGHFCLQVLVSDWKLIK